MTRAWFERDVATRSRLAVAGARDAFAAHLASADRRRLGALLDAMSRDEHIAGAAACAPSGATLARTRTFPGGLECEVLGASVATTRDAHFSAVRDGRAVRVSIVPVMDDGDLLGRVVLVHDMTYAAHRDRAVGRLTAGMFGIVAALAALLTYLMQRFSWRSWTHELRRVLFMSRGARPERSTRGPFQPLLADVHRLVAELASDESRASSGPWTAERLQATLERSLHGEGVVVLSNREPYLHERTADGGVKVVRPASGLVTALEPVMRACSGTWIAHGSGSADRDAVDRDDRVSVPPGEDAYVLRRVWLSPEEEQGYYYGFSNEGLWPLCHAAHVRPTFRAADWQHYASVNARFAEVASREVEGSDPIVLVQDYHFALAPSLIRDRLPRATVITFWHIPWPNAERFGTCPFAKELLTGMLGSTVLGFHTQLHCNNFLESVERFLEARIDRERQAVVLGGRETLVRSYPISVEWPSEVARRVAPAADCRRSVWAELGLARDALLGVGVDRLDYTKGIVERLQAVERLLERFPRLRGRFTFVQLAAPSRSLIESYRALEANVEALAARINERYASGTYRPVVLLRANHAAEVVFRFLRAADVCYVSSLDDGMNLVAKEFVAARDDHRGVLVLSRFTGAARELREALVVNPYDLEESSGALAAAVRMRAEEQAERMRAMRASVAELNVYHWAGRMLTDAARVRRDGRLSDRLSPVLRAASEVHG
ncbi:MAG TPA: trehalose-6-phosphate synthase [Anaeromyxobacteraceae bacterium]|nr:trehalose-6-phosphate synthase [Anaeromyxobacteraceae bacterium]